MAELCSHPGCCQRHDNWPAGTTDGQLCQDHWEAESDRLWWLAVQGIPPWPWALNINHRGHYERSRAN